MTKVQGSGTSLINLAPPVPAEALVRVKRAALKSLPGVIGKEFRSRGAGTTGEGCALVPNGLPKHMSPERLERLDFVAA